MQENKIYLKVLKDNRTHYDLTYVKGYNEVKKFVETGSCVPGRIYFCDPKDKSQNICRYLHYGDILVDITLPTNDPDFKMIIDPSGGKSASNKIIIGRERNLSDPKTFEYMANCGVDISKNYVLKWALDKNYWDIVLYLMFITPLTSSRIGLIEHVLSNLSKRLESKCLEYINAKNEIKFFYKEHDPIIFDIIKLYDVLNDPIRHNFIIGKNDFMELIKSILNDYRILIINYKYYNYFPESQKILLEINNRFK
ncbi:ankyrin repeat protein [Megavirus baoshan]|uniref:Ankyrin repeat protein n=1 Tax=Megavirus baoshan TaxID=2496520 RepID=A0A3S5HLD3_9VIRU|nr:ankyrin repeat protein [Megavirus baoshan]AZL89632.1 ankyrin repeat protein [Megavirus baoshan]